MINDWLSAYRKGRDDFKSAVDANYEKVEDFWAGFEPGKPE